MRNARNKKIQSYSGNFAQRYKTIKWLAEQLDKKPNTVSR